jgi:hypothetical protein
VILVNLSGGLGNQMFQYAFGRSLSQYHQTELILDLSNYSTAISPSINEYGLAVRKYELGCFLIKPTFSEIAHKNFFFPKNSIRSKILYKVERMLKRKTLVFESQNGYHEKIWNQIQRNTYVQGFWQSPLYFKGIEQLLKNDFKFNLNISRDKQLESHIQQCNSIAIHVRRGDYESSKIVQNIHGLCSLAYYKNATNFIMNKTLSPKFYIFSDDIEWCKSNFNWLPNAHYITNKDSPAYYDMYLMSICKSIIIANSTFSWWGAWLNINPNKIVIAPSLWFKNTTADELKIYPMDWISI